MQLKDYVQDLIDQKEIKIGVQASPNVRLLIYQNSFPAHHKNPRKSPANHLVTTKLKMIKINRVIIETSFITIHPPTWTMEILSTTYFKKSLP